MASSSVLAAPFAGQTSAITSDRFALLFVGLTFVAIGGVTVNPRVGERPVPPPQTTTGA